MAEAGYDNRFPIIIGVAGGTGSGKSTFTNRLKKLFGDHVTVLYYDNYYRAHNDIPGFPASSANFSIFLLLFFSIYDILFSLQKQYIIKILQIGVWLSLARALP